MKVKQQSVKSEKRTPDKDILLFNNVQMLKPVRHLRRKSQRSSRKARKETFS